MWINGLAFRKKKRWISKDFTTPIYIFFVWFNLTKNYYDIHVNFHIHHITKKAKYKKKLIEWKEYFFLSKIDHPRYWKPIIVHLFNKSTDRKLYRSNGNYKNSPYSEIIINNYIVINSLKTKRSFKNKYKNGTITIKSRRTSWWNGVEWDELRRGQSFREKLVS